MLWSIGKSFLDQAIKKDLKAYDNNRKIATGQRDNYTSGCLLNYPYFKKNYKLIAIDLNKQQKLDADPKTIQQINFTRNLNWAEVGTKFFIIEETEEKVLDFSKGTAKVLWFFFRLISILDNINMTRLNITS